MTLPLAVLFALRALFVITNADVDKDPEPVVVFELAFGEMMAVSPKWTTPPPTLKICSGPIIAGKIYHLLSIENALHDLPVFRCSSWCHVSARVPEKRVKLADMMDS